MKPVGNYVMVKPTRTQEEIAGKFVNKNGIYLSWNECFAKKDRKAYVKEINKLIVAQINAKRQTEKDELEKEIVRLRKELKNYEDDKTLLNVAQHTVTDGVIVGISDHIHYNDDPVFKGYRGQLKFDVDMEVKIGDIVIFHYMESLNSQRDGRYIDGMMLIEYSSIFCVIRGKEVIPVNGYLLVEPLEEKSSEILWINGRPSETKGIVRYAGTPVRRYLDDKDASDSVPVIWRDGELKIEMKFPEVGDTVVFKDCHAVKLQYPLHALLNKDLYQMQRRSVTCIQTTTEINITC